MIKLIFILTAITLLLEAEFKTPPGYSSRNRSAATVQEKDINNMYPVNTDKSLEYMNSKLRQNHFIINIDEEEVNFIRDRKIRYKKIMDNTLNVKFIQEPDRRLFTAVDTIFLVNNYITTLTMPREYKVHALKPSVKMEEASFSSNLVFLKPKKNFIEGNVIVSLSDGNHNMVMTIIIKKFSPKFSVFDEKRKRYLTDNTAVSIFINYLDKPKISNFTILQQYFRLYGKERKKFFSHDSKYDLIIIKGIPYYLIRDDKFGDIHYLGINFKITNKH